VFQFDPVPAFAGFTVAVCWGLALFVSRSGGAPGRRLGLLLAVEGFALGSSGVFDLFLAPSALAADAYPNWVLANGVVHFIADGAMLALYPVFLASVLDTPLVRPFRTAWGRRAAAGTAMVLILLAWFAPILLGAGILYVAMVSLFGYALIASLHSWRRAPTGLARVRAGALALGFGFRDVCWGVTYALGIRQLLQGSGSDPLAYPGYFYVIYSMGTAVAVPVIAYGILRAKLFDIDLRIRWTLERSTLAGAFVALLYLITEGAERILSSELGAWAGLLAAAVLVFFLAPLQRLAERVAGAAMPRTQDTPAYAAFRKLQVYEAALQDANRDGGISDKERRLLDRLRDSLGIEATDAAALERDLMT